MPNTPRINIPYPKENEDPWYDSFVKFVEALDISGFSAREDRHLLFMGGGQVALSEEGELSWSEDIEILAAITGFLWTVPAGNIQVEEGGLVYVDLVRAPTLSTPITINVASQVPSTDSALLLGALRGERLFFRNGQSLALGESKRIFEGASLGSEGQVLRNTIPIASNEIINQDDIFSSLGMLALDPEENNFSGATSKVVFSTISSVLDPADTLTIQLYNLTDDVVIETHSDNFLEPTEVLTEVVLTDGRKIYEIRAKLAAPKTNDGMVSFAGIHVDLVRD